MLLPLPWCTTAAKIFLLTIHPPPPSHTPLHIGTIVHSRLLISNPQQNTKHKRSKCVESRPHRLWNYFCPSKSQHSILDCEFAPSTQRRSEGEVFLPASMKPLPRTSRSELLLLAFSWLMIYLKFGGALSWERNPAHDPTTSWTQINYFKSPLEIWDGSVRDRLIFD